MKSSRFSTITFGALLLAAPALAIACCPSGGQGVTVARTGLGESQPAALDLSADPAWQVYAFEREGVSYYQVNDLAGEVKLIIASIDGTFWTLPAGKREERVSLPGKSLVLPKSARRSVVYQGGGFSLVLYSTGADTVWAVEPTPSGQ